MELSPYVEGLRRDLATLTRFAPADVVKLAEQLAEALDSPVRLILLDVLTSAAAEITDRLDATVIDVRLSAGEPEFVVTHHEQEQAPVAEPVTVSEEGTARVTLRLPEALKTKVEASATAAGVSVNTWLVQATARAVEEQGAGARPRRVVSGSRITGFARS
ncbi:MAG TPA: toxin-antitoxin system HicB family antitoxin [Streptosporangiaceae bacterium]|nr:toxin-antitoxin system HicB family antitoxin [Streptosporangiaceae bacterium]